MDYYESHRALGKLYRAVSLKSPPERAKEKSVDPCDDNVTLALRPKVLGVIPNLHEVERAREQEIIKIFEHYQDELSYISWTHVITNQPGARLAEEEIVTGTIVAKASLLTLTVSGNLWVFCSLLKRGGGMNAYTECSSTQIRSPTKLDAS